MVDEISELRSVLKASIPDGDYRTQRSKSRLRTLCGSWHCKRLKSSSFQTQSQKRTWAKAPLCPRYAHRCLSSVPENVITAVQHSTIRAHQYESLADLTLTPKHTSVRWFFTALQSDAECQDFNCLMPRVKPAEFLELAAHVR